MRPRVSLTAFLARHDLDGGAAGARAEVRAVPVVRPERAEAEALMPVERQYRQHQPDDQEGDKDHRNDRQQDRQTAGAADKRGLHPATRPGCGVLLRRRHIQDYAPIGG